MNTVAAVPSTRATATIAQNWISPVATIAAKAPMATTRTTSEPIIRRLRLQRSAATPAASEKSPNGARRANVTSPAFAGEPVTASVSSG